MTAAIRVEDLRKQYGHHMAVDGVSFEVQIGEIFGFLGPNGAGKTTIIRLLCALARPTGGNIEILSCPIPSEFRRVANEIGALVEQPAFYPHLSGMDNLRVLAWTAQQRITTARIDRLLELVGIDDDVVHRKVRNYSTGMRQRLGLAAAMLCEPKILILDEPTSGLDPIGVREFRSLFRALADDGTTIFLSSHQLLEVELLCHRVCLLDKGRVVRYGAVETVMDGAGGIAVKVSEVNAAVETLSVQGIATGVEGDWVSASGQRAEEVLRVLGENGIYPLDVRRPRLEDLFVAATERDLDERDSEAKS